jgi:hydroxypyruvate isomerase
MLRFSANLTMLFNEVDFLDRFDLAAQAGFKAVEFKAPFAYPKEVIVERLRRNGLEAALFNMPAGDWDNGERGIGALPGREAELRENVAKTIEYAQAFGCTRVNLLGGIPPAGVTAEVATRTFVANLRYAAGELKKYGIRVVVEPVNTYDSPGVLVTRTDQAAAIIRETGSDNIGIEYDVYQAQLMEGDLSNTIRKYMPLIWHMQVGDAPSRAQPGTGEINFANVLSVIDEAGYTGWIGCDYRPTGSTFASFDWIEHWDPAVYRATKALGARS